MVMATGTVMWFNASKHYGFIAPDAGGRDVFLHQSVLEAAKLASLQDGARVCFDLVHDGERTAAANLTLLEAPSSA
jgi:CspA family cold shock protein